MRLIIAGTRTFPVKRLARLMPRLVATLRRELDLPEVSLVLCGGASGVDAAGRVWAKAEGIHYQVVPADWSRRPWERRNPGGPIRNAQMAADADALLLIWNGRSPGSRSMRDLALGRRMPVLEVILDGSGTPRFVVHARQLRLLEDA